MTQIPAESSVWRRVENYRPPVEEFDDELLPPFPEAHRGEWMDDPRYAPKRVEPFISAAGDERAAYGDDHDSDTSLERP